MKNLILILIFITIFSTANFAQNEPVCPTLHITGPSSVTMPGETATFSASLIDGTYDERKIKYKWSVNEGRIIEGQGTSSMIVNTDGLDGVNITATVEVQGLSNKCGTISASEIAVIPFIDGVESYGIINFKDDEIEVLIDSFIIRLKNNPSATLYLLSYGSAEEIEKREQLIKSYFDNRSFDLKKIVFLSRVENVEIRTEVYLVLQGAEPPTL